MRDWRPGVGDMRFAANEIRIGIIFQTFASLYIMYVCMVCVCMCVLCAHARVYTKHPLTYPFPVPSNYKFYELPTREPNSAFCTSRFMTANHPRPCVYRLFCYFKNCIRLNSELRQRKGVPTLVCEWVSMKETHVNRHPSTKNIGSHMSLPPNRRMDGTHLPNTLALKSHENRRDRSTKDNCKWNQSEVRQPDVF